MPKLNGEQEPVKIVNVQVESQESDKPGRWMSEDEFQALVGAVQLSLGLARTVRRVLADIDDRIADITQVMRDAQLRLKAQPEPKREQVL